MPASQMGHSESERNKVCLHSLNRSKLGTSAVSVSERMSSKHTRSEIVQFLHFEAVGVL